MPAPRLTPAKRLGYLLAAAFYFLVGGFSLRAFWRLGLGESASTALTTLLGIVICLVFLVPALWLLWRVVSGESDGPQF